MTITDKSYRDRKAKEEEETSRRIELQSIVRDSFGFCATGYLTVREDIEGDEIVHCRSLDKIGTVGLLGLFMHNPTIYGKFTKEDGSELEVFGEYEKKARRYVELFRTRTGREARITLI